MRAIRILMLVLLPVIAFPANASEDADDWKMIGGVLALVQQIVHLAANSPDPNAAPKGVDAILSGQDAQANRIASGVLDEVLQDLPAEQRGTFVAIGRDLLTLTLTLARRERERAAAAPATERTAQPDPVQARKDLHAMGLKYWDEQQFLQAARRGDRIAVELFLAARGLEASSLPPAR
jgi:hypothetical protein